MKSLSQNSRSPDLDFNPGPPEYEAGMLTSRPRLSVPLKSRMMRQTDYEALTRITHKIFSLKTCREETT
jgi:hypothetical protein